MDRVTWVQIAVEQRNFALITQLRSVSKVSLNAAEDALLEEARAWVNMFFSTGDAERYFHDVSKLLSTTGGLEGLAAEQASRKSSEFRNAIQGASIVFSHSVLDGAAQDYCTVTALASPDSWGRFILQKRVTLEDVRDSDYGKLVRVKVDEELARLEKESVLKKIERLFAICQPETGYNPFVKPFKFDRERLNDLDKRRHDVVHGSVLREPIRFSDEDLLYCFDVSNYLLALVIETFDLRMDPQIFITASGPLRPSEIKELP